MTHKSQDDPKKKADTAITFLETTRILITQQNWHKQYIINMDQTPYDLHDSPRKTYTKKGTKTVNAVD